MGGTTSGTIEESMIWLMPVYYTREALTKEDLDTCNNMWNGILHDTIPNYLIQSTKPGFEYNCCRAWFYHTFYNRLRDLHPYTTGLFINGIDTVGVFMVKMISVSFTQLQKKTDFESSMRALAIRHCERGIHANEFVLFGDVLFYSLKYVVGPDLYTQLVDQSWKRLYSSMLTIIIPECIRFGLNLQQKGGAVTELREKAKVGSFSYGNDEILHNHQNQQLSQIPLTPQSKHIVQALKVAATANQTEDA
mmetsp:Transcript_22032/g.22763  ORF Transcript_22032/g.22763 Transcript_22032/m.22763 type:complete len:249 (-) Transcript_22032:116-862(-)